MFQMVLPSPRLELEKMKEWVNQWHSYACPLISWQLPTDLQILRLYNLFHGLFLWFPVVATVTGITNNAPAGDLWWKESTAYCKVTV